MNVLRSARLALAALALSLVSAASAHAGVLISVGFAPPVLPVYVQPPCPEPGYMWTPGYWAYGPDGYYWVAGTWVPAPYAGALWTPGYWGFGGGLYVWHAGYWGPHVGYYGGINYGFGYMGVGFVGGVWHGGAFVYNTAIIHVGVGPRWAGRTYMDRAIIARNTVANDRHFAFSGPGGVRHDPRPEERLADHDHHMERTSFQEQHEHTAMASHGARFNGGAHPGSGAGHPGTEHGPQGGHQPARAEGGRPEGGGHPEGGAHGEGGGHEGGGGHGRR